MKLTSVFFLFALLLPLLVSCVEQKSYIVYLGHHSGEKTHEEIEEYHHSYLFSLRESKEAARSSLLYSYKNSINGFAAMLTPDEALKLSEVDEVVAVIPSKARTLHTTRSWEFLGVRKGAKRNSTNKNELLLKAGYGKQIIVGLLDTGIWPESKSLSDKGMSPIPKKWKGICQHGDAWNSSHCNKKIIGARYYLKGYENYFGPLNRSLSYGSARDSSGHGTHTSSTVGGQIVHAKLKGGFGHGTASGGAPLAHLAMYKVCWPEPQDPTKGTCMEEDILAAIDDAIGDGVDVLSMSLGGDSYDYAHDLTAIGSLHAVENNIVVACSAGNEGPFAYSVSNSAPWIITVAASSLDRAFAAPLSLGNGTKIMGETVTSYKLEEKMYPLVYAGDIEKANVNKNVSGLCMDSSLSPAKTKGKIVFCLRGVNPRISKGQEVKRAGGAGFILGNSPDSGDEATVDAHVLPATAVGSTNAQNILQHIKSTQNPMAYIYPARTSLDLKPAPKMASFSSRGPNFITPDILKPDITAPGMNILAAWPESSSGPQKYNIESGTSMSCPHVAAIVALIKSIHPTWSIAAIKSAMMTTAVQTNNMKLPITDSSGIKASPFQYGSGHIHPTSAADPGLVYDASYSDYLLFLCRGDAQAVGKSFKCPPNPPSLNNLNYPSLAISKLNGTMTVERVVTNVGESGATYVSKVEAPPGVSVKVFPSTLVFHRVGEKMRFTITVEAGKSNSKKKEDYAFGWYSWSDGVHVVRSPMAINLA